jgi:hypothetical protein
MPSNIRAFLMMISVASFTSSLRRGSEEVSNMRFAKITCAMAVTVYCPTLSRAAIFNPAFEGNYRTGNKTVVVAFDEPLFCGYFCALGSALSV